MAYLKGTYICNGIFPKLRVAMAFLNFAEIAMASIQLTQILMLILLSILFDYFTDCARNLVIVDQQYGRTLIVVYGSWVWHL
jgi:hypothetical protein